MQFVQILVDSIIIGWSLGNLSMAYRLSHSLFLVELQRNEMIKSPIPFGLVVCSAQHLTIIFSS